MPQTQPTPPVDAAAQSAGYLASWLGLDRTAQSATETFDVMRDRLTNLRESSREVTLGAFDALQTFLNNLSQSQSDEPSSSTQTSTSWNQIRPIRDALQFLSDSGLSDAISDQVHRAASRTGEMISDQMHRAASRAGAIALDQILSFSHGCELDPRDARLIQALQSGQSSENSSEIWEAMKKYHIVCLGKDFSPRKSSSIESIRSTRNLIESISETQPRRSVSQPQLLNDGEIPIQSLLACKDLYRAIKERHRIPNSSNPDPLPPMPERTETLSVYGNRLQALEETTDQMIEGFIQKMLHFSTMIIVDKCCGNNITPAEYQRIIEESLHTQQNPRVNYVNRNSSIRFKKIRHFFRNLFYKMIYSLITPLIDKVLHQVVEALRDFLKNEQEINEFIKEKFDDASGYYSWVDNKRREWIRTGGNGEIFERYLRDQPRNFGSHELNEEEVITAFGNYIVENHIPKPKIPVFGRVAHWMRKFLVRRTLQETRILQRIFDRGTHSILSAQLELKRMLNGRLEEIADMIDRSRVRRVAQLNNEGESPEESALQMEKDRLFSPALRCAMTLHSDRLLKFSEIISCNGIRERLARLDDPQDPLISRVTQILQLPEFPLQEIMSQAATNTTETVLLSLLKDRECQTEQQLQKVFRVLDRSYGGQSPSSDRQTEELHRVEQQLFRSIEMISSASVEAGLEEKIKNVSARRHKQIKDFVAKEKQHFESFITQFNRLQESIDSSQSVTIIPLLETSLNQIADYLSYIQTTMRSSEFKGCYTDVQGDLHNAYAILIRTFSQQATEIDDMLTKAKQNLELERQLSEVRDVLENLSQPGADLPQSNHIPSDITDLWEQKATLEEQRALSIELESIQREATDCSRKIEKIREVRHFAELIRTYYNEPPSRTQTLSEIRRLWRDPEIRELIPLNESSTEALYRFLYPQGYFGRRTASAFFTSLQTRETRYQARLNQLNRQISTLQESVHDDLETIENSYQNILNQLRTRVTQVGSQLLDQIDANSASIQAKSTQLSNEISDFRNISDRLQVQGYISVGELRLYQTLEPILVNHFAPRIRKVIQTLINALNDDLHYKDLLLRIGFVGIANRQRESQE